MAALALYVVGGTTGLWLDALPGLLGGRVLLGLAVALIMTIATALIADLYPPERRGTMLQCDRATARSRRDDSIGLTDAPPRRSADAGIDGPRTAAVAGATRFGGN